MLPKKKQQPLAGTDEEQEVAYNQVMELMRKYDITTHSEVYTMTTILFYVLKVNIFSGQPSED